MKLLQKKIIVSLLCLAFMACSGLEQSEHEKQRRENSKGEYIYRQSGNYLFNIDTPKSRTKENYPWEDDIFTNIPKITKEYFRCRGSYSNCTIMEEEDNGNFKTFTDCEGANKHSLPLINGKEGVYPILIELLNYLQKETKRKVVITCGHRCPIHNTYSDRSKENKISKHMVGAEVDFYVQSMEEKPIDIVDLILAFYQHNKKYAKDPSYKTFQRYEGKDTNVSIKPWFNKEVFIKLFKSDEGRDFDNRHPYPYISIQVRYDTNNQGKVCYSWEKAHQGYMRW